jgi:Ca2+-transporting ATPase
VVIAGYGSIITLATLTAFVVAIEALGLSASSAVTVSFLTIALAQLWHVFNMREHNSSLLHNEITRNRYVWAALVLCVGLVLAAVYLPGLSGILGLSAPPLAGWGLAVGLSFLPLILGQIAKMAPIGRLRAGFDRSSQ